MKSYRVYCMDGASRIQSVEIIEATNDADALVAAKRLQQGLNREIWDRDRRVGKIGPRKPAASHSRKMMIEEFQRW